MNCDEQIRDLVYTLDEVYSFLQDADALKVTLGLNKKLEVPSLTRRQLEILILLAKQTFQCIHFILDYVKDVGYCMWYILLVSWKLITSREKICEACCVRNRWQDTGVQD